MDIIYNRKYIYNFQKGEKILSINPDGVNEIIYSLESPEISFYLSNENQGKLNKDFLAREINFFQETYGKKTKADFFFINHDKLKTKLPNLVFDKALIESTYNKNILKDGILNGIYTNLKVNGKLFVKVYLIENGKKLNFHNNLKKIIVDMKGLGFEFVEKYEKSDICEFTKVK